MSIPASSYKNTFPERVFSFQTIARNESKDLISITLTDWLGSNDMVSLEKPTTADTSNKIQEINFSLSETLAGYFPLLRGILASARSQTWVFQANNKLKSFKLNYNVHQEAEAKEYLTKVLDIIEAEARFKQVLRKVIVNQDNFHREEKLLLMELSK